MCCVTIAFTDRCHELRFNTQEKGHYEIKGRKWLVYGNEWIQNSVGLWCEIQMQWKLGTDERWESMNGCFLP